MKNKYVNLLFITILFVIVLPLDIVNAAPENPANAGGESLTITAEGDDSSSGNANCTVPSGYEVYDTVTSTGTVVSLMTTTIGRSWKAYDMENNIIEDIVSGTRFMANLEEYKIEKYSCRVVTYTKKYYRQITGWTCPYSCRPTIINPLNSGTCNCSLQPVYDNYGSTDKCATSSVECSSKVVDKKSDEKLKGIKLDSNYKVEIPDPNDYNCSGDECNDIKIEKPIPSTTKEVNYSNATFTIRIDLSYEMNKTCINVKTGKVRYLTSGIECNDNEYEVPKLSNNQWNIFTPLNMKSNEKFIVNITSNNSELTGEECQSFINQNENYLNRVKPKSGRFDGTNNDVTTAAKGCVYLDIKLVVTAEQQFYNEEESDGKTVFKGFEFSYRPINIDDPFPNVTSSKDMVTKNSNGKELKSYWYNWYTNYNNSQSKLKIVNSFDNVTYVADVTDTSGIRSLGSDYADWEYMNVNGTSSFISDYGYVVRNKGMTFYKLGCGPLNSDEYINGKKNPLYLEECKEVTKK